MSKFWPKKLDKKRADNLSTAAWNVCSHAEKLHKGGAALGDYWTVRYPITTIDALKPNATIAIFTGGGLEVHLKLFRDSERWWENNWAVFKAGNLIYHTPKTEMWRRSEDLPEVLEVIDEHWSGDLLEATLAVGVFPVFVEAANALVGHVGHNFIRREVKDEEEVAEVEKRFETLLFAANYFNEGEAWLESLTWRERRKFKYWLKAFDRIDKKVYQWSPPTTFYLSMGSGFLILGLILMVQVLIGYGIMFLIFALGLHSGTKIASWRKKKSGDADEDSEVEESNTVELAPVSGAKEDVNPEQSLFDALDAAERGRA